MSTFVPAPAPATCPARVTDLPNVSVRGVACIETASEPGAAVVNATSLPLTVPDGFVATSRKWYVVDGARPVTTAETALSPLPRIGPSTGVELPYAVVVP